MLSRTMAFLFGVITLQQLESLPSWPWLGAFFLPILLFFLFPARRCWSLPLLAFVCGLGWAALHAHWQLERRLAPELEGQDLLVQGYVRSLPQADGRRLGFELRPQQASLNGQPVTMRANLRLNWYGDYPKNLLPGQQWQLLVRLKRPWGMMNPGGFDYEGWLYQQGLGATGYVRSSAQNRLLDDDPRSYPLQRLRYRLYRALQAALGEHPAHGIIPALAMGERSGMSDAQWKVLLSTGTNHLMAISGLHVGMVAGFAFLLVRWLWSWCAPCCLRLPAPRAAAVAALLAGMCYAALAGFSIPTQRALIMLAVVLGAIWWQRPLAAGRALMLALWLVLLWQPAAVLAAGFWLSFAAVALILYGMQGRLHATGLWWKWGRVQWLVSIGLLPLLILFFGRGSLSSPLANLLAVPWVSMLVVPLTLLGSVFVLWWEAAGSWLLLSAATLFQWLWPLLGWLDEHVPVLQLPAVGWPLVLAALGLFWWFLPRGWPFRSLGLVLCLPVLLWHPETPQQGEAWITLLDVGQGQAIVVQTHNHVLVMDTGPRFPSGFNTGDAVLLPFLQQQGLRSVDRLVISHSDSDHLGGAQALLDGIAVREVLVGEGRKMGQIAHQPCWQGDMWHWDGVVFRFLHPDKPPHERQGNDDSCVLHIQAGSHSMLIAGDISVRAERLMLGRGEILKADVLVAPHHGSKGSSSAEFVAAVAPTQVLYSAGYRNRHGHPHPDVVARYRQIGAEDWETWRDGAIRVVMGGDNEPVLTAYRESARRYWHSRAVSISR